MDGLPVATPGASGAGLSVAASVAGLAGLRAASGDGLRAGVAVAGGGAAASGATSLEVEACGEIDLGRPQVQETFNVPHSERDIVDLFLEPHDHTACG